jgi:hypothetical protein
VGDETSRRRRGRQQARRWWNMERNEDGVRRKRPRGEVSRRWKRDNSGSGAGWTGSMSATSEAAMRRGSALVVSAAQRTMAKKRAVGTQPAAASTGGAEGSAHRLRWGGN